MSDPLAEFDTGAAVSVTHWNAPENVCEVELELKVSVVWHWKTAHDCSVPRTIYIPAATALLGCCQWPVLGVDLVGQQPVYLGIAWAVTLTDGQGPFLGTRRVPRPRNLLQSPHNGNTRKNEIA